MRKLIPVALASLLLIALAFAQTTRVGPLPSADSLAINQRVGRTGETITQAAGGGNKERVRRGNCYFAGDAGTGIAVTSGAGTTANLSLYNPQNSGVLVVLNKVYLTYASGTLGASTLYHTINGTTTQTAPSGGTLATNIPALGGSNNGSVAQCRILSTVVQGSTISQLSYLAPELGTTVTAPQLTIDNLDDCIQLLPGTSYQVQGGATGTSAKVSLCVFWEEQPLLNGAP